MSDSELTDLIARVERLPDREIVQALAASSDYTLEAIVVYEQEAQRRGIRQEVVQALARQEAQRRKDRTASTRSFHGIGERLFGERDYRADGSYRTTKWFVFFYLPIYPIATFRVRPTDARKHTVLEKLPIDWRQAIDTYAFVALSWATIVFVGRWIERHLPLLPGWSYVCLFSLPVLYLYLVRRRALWRAQKNEHPASPPSEPPVIFKPTGSGR